MLKLTDKRWWWAWDIIPVYRFKNHAVTFKRLATMPAKDLYHQTVKNALIRDQWSIMHNPLTLKLGKKFFMWIWVQVNCWQQKKSIVRLQLKLEIIERWITPS
jgi:hypothetical protein